MHESNVAEKLYQKRGASCLLLIKMAFLSVSVIAVCGRQSPLKPWLTLERAKSLLLNEVEAAEIQTRGYFASLESALTTWSSPLSMPHFQIDYRCDRCGFFGAISVNFSENAGK